MFTIRPFEQQDADRVLDLVTQAFNLPASGRDRSRSDFSPSANRVVEQDGRLVACLRIHRFAHFWGGRAVPAAGIAGVAVAAEARGKGIGGALMRETLRELRTEGLPASSLYPATVPIYRAAGYGYGGIRTGWKINLRDVPDERGLSLEPFDDGALPEIDACYVTFAEQTNGLVRRDATWWEKRVFTAWDDSPTYRYLVREDGRVTGFVIYRPQASKDDWRWTLMCRDLIWTTPAAGRALLSLSSLHRSTAGRMDWIGPPSEPLADLMPEDHVELDHAFRYMVRLLDVPAAFEARGFGPRAEAAVTVRARDPLFPENEGPWRIEVADGRAKVVPSDEARATVDVATLASMWTGLTRARDAVRTGGLEADADTIEELEAIFAGPTPWIADFF